MYSHLCINYIVFKIISSKKKKTKKSLEIEEKHFEIDSIHQGDNRVGDSHQRKLNFSYMIVC